MTVDHPLVSWHHAKLERTPSGIKLEDLGSTNGTFIDGRRISRARLGPGSTFSIAGVSFEVDSTGDLRRIDTIQIDIERARISVGRGARRHDLLEDISLTVEPRQLVAIMGPSGAGKTTLLEAINGYNPPSSGRVLFNGRSLYQNFDQFRLRIGYVPQDDILHPQLSVREALRFTARLRLPPDTHDNEIDRRIEQTLEDLLIVELADRRIGSPMERDKVLSGGQRKRVNLAMELLTDPLILFLDEPTSGLSSADALQVVTVLRRLADQGKTVLLSIHQPSLDLYQQMTHLLMLAKDSGQPTPARLAYFGPAYPASIQYFQPKRSASDSTPHRLTPESIFDGLKRHSAAEWARRYEASRPARPSIPEDGETPSCHATRPPPPPILYQAWSLLCRNLAGSSAAAARCFSSTVGR